MKLKFLKASFGIDFEFDSDLFEVLDKECKKGGVIGIYSAVQFLPKLKELREVLEKKEFKVVSSRPDRASFDGQILGCDSYFENLNLKVDVDCFLYVGDGNFHPLALLFAQESFDKKVPVIVFNPVQKQVEVLGVDVIERNLKRRKGNLLKFHTSQVIGVFVSSKWGQEYMESSLKLKEMYSDKMFYFFVGDNFNEFEMDNFPFIECWVNSACPRIGQDDVVRQKKAVVNLKDVWKNE